MTHPYGCSSRPWSIFILFYVFLIFVAGALPFILGRVVNISTRVEHRSDYYREVTFWGDLSEPDVAAAESQLDEFTVRPSSYSLVSTLGTLSHGTQDYVWTLASFTDRSSLPNIVQMEYEEDDVYFAELTQSQLRVDGKGLGTFRQNAYTNRDEYPPLTLGNLDGVLLKCVVHTQGET